MNEDVKAKALKWLRETGYPLELRVGRRFQVAGWDTNYSRWYSDPETGKAREMDAQAIVGAIHPGRASVFLSLCVECKSSRDKPWVGLGSGTALGAAGLLSFALGRLSRTTFVAARSEGVAFPNVLPEDTPRVGGLVQVFGSREEHSPSPAYGALLQARAAVLALDQDYAATASRVAGDFRTIAAFVPLVVLDGRLFVYTVGDALQEDLREVDALAASVPGDGENETALIPVVTERWVGRMCAPLHASAHGFCVAMLPYAPTVIAAYSIGALDIERGGNRDAGRGEP